MDTVQRDSCVLLSDYEQLIETGTPPGRGKEGQKLAAARGGACLQERDFALLTLSDQLILCETGLRDSGSDEQMVSRAPS